MVGPTIDVRGGGIGNALVPPAFRPLTLNYQDVPNLTPLLLKKQHYMLVNISTRFAAGYINIVCPMAMCREREVVFEAIKKVLDDEKAKNRVVLVHFRT